MTANRWTTVWAVPLLAMSMTSAAFAQSGDLVYWNRTDQTLKVHGKSYTDKDGTKHDLAGFWEMKPGERARLTDENSTIHGTLFEYALETAEGKSTWTGRCLKDRQFLVSLTVKNLDEHYKDFNRRPAGEARVGALYLSNPSGEAIQVTAQWSEDRTGKRAPLSAAGWKVGTGAGAYAAIDNRTVVASKIGFTVTTAGGTSTWTSSAADFDADGDLHLKFHAAILARHRAATGPVAVAVVPGGAGAVDRYQPTDNGEKIASAIAKIVGAAVADDISKPRNGDDLFDLIGRGLAGLGRDELIESAIGDVFPKLYAGEKRDLRTVISLALDGRLSLENLREERAKQQIIAALRQKNRDLGDSAAVADFIYTIYKSRR